MHPSLHKDVRGRVRFFIFLLYFPTMDYYAKVADAKDYFSSKILPYLRRHTALSVVVGIAIVWGAYALLARNGGPELESAIAVRKAIIREVQATGKVRPAESVTLGFETSGRVASVPVKEGMEVAEGAILARQEGAVLYADVQSARARIAEDEAALLELRRGLRPEERSVEAQKARNAESSRDDALVSLIVAIRGAQTSADDALRGRADKLFENADSAAPRFRVPISDGALQGEIEMRRATFSGAMNSWKRDIDAVSTASLDGAKLYSLAGDSDKFLREVREFLDRMSYSLTFAMSPQAISQSTVDSYRADLSAARTNVNTSLTSLQSAVEAARDAQSAFDLARREQELELAPASQEEIAQKEALLLQSRAALSGALGRAGKALIIAPITGIITNVSIETGEIVGANVPAVSMISASAFEIEAFVPETDIASVRAGREARVTLDAYGEDVVWDVNIVSVNPAETVVEGVSTYKTILQFSGQDDRVKSGMTANIEIITERKENTLALPQRFVKEEDAKYFVSVRNADGEITKREVAVGLVGSEGEIEIISGLEEGEEAVIQG